MVIEEHARLEILLPSDSSWRIINENDIINNSLSISSKCMDDSSFSLGGVYSAQLSAKIRLENTNAYKLTGAKVKVFSRYGSNTEKLRGVFWITSVTRNKNIYTISGSDAIVWLDSTSYETNGECGNLIYGRLASNIGNLGYKVSQIVETVNEFLDAENKINVYVNENVINYQPSGVGYYLLPADKVGEISTKNPRDYISWLAELACGFAFMDYSSGTPFLTIGQFGEEILNEVSVDEIELNSCEIADFIIQINGVWTNVYSGAFGGIGSCKGGIVIDISENPFKDGHWEQNGENAMDILRNIGGKIWGDLDNCNGLFFRPFSLKCHCQKYFELGQKIKLPDGNISWITSIKWTFRGGYTLSCAGKDTRVLYASAKRSLSAKVKDLAYTKVNTEIAKLKNEITDGEFQGLKGDTGEKGADGFSPTIEVSESTDTSYILKITDKNGSFLTPNFLKNIIIDNFLSETSENAVQNKVITLKLKEFDNMFSEIKKLLEEIKALIGGDSDSKLYGLVCSDLIGLSEGVSGDLTIVESEG